MTCRKTIPLLLLSLTLGCSALHGQPMSLSACMDYAVGHSTEMRLSAADRSDERAEKVQALLSAFTPSVSAQSYAYNQYGRNMDPETNTYTDFTTFHNGYSLSAGITLFDGFQAIDNPVRVKGDRDISVNLRYKQGRLLDYNPKLVFEVKEPRRIFLPKRYITSPYIFAHCGDFFAYPNNYNQYVQYYMNTFQHGGISMEEILIPFITLRSK